jgi:hypothetical protein
VDASGEALSRAAPAMSVMSMGFDDSFFIDCSFRLPYSRSGSTSDVLSVPARLAGLSDVLLTRKS